MCGLVTIAPQRLMRLTINKNERNKLLKERAMADVLAAHGYRVHLVEEDSRTGSYDALINGIPADFKRTKSHNDSEGVFHPIFLYRQKTRIIHSSKNKTAPETGLSIWYDCRHQPGDIPYFIKLMQR